MLYKPPGKCRPDGAMALRLPPTNSRLRTDVHIATWRPSIPIPRAARRALNRRPHCDSAVVARRALTVARAPLRLALGRCQCPRDALNLAQFPSRRDGPLFKPNAGVAADPRGAFIGAERDLDEEQGVW
jgi:hypothetical protein